MSQDDTIEARLDEQEYFRPPPDFVGQANETDSGVYDRFEDQYPEAYAEWADLLTWESDWDAVLDDSNPPFFEWFQGGTLNASVNAVDRHLPERKDQTALLWEGEPGDTERIAYQDLYRRINEMAAVYKEVGVREDDVVTLHLPMVPALPVSMLGAARIGAPHSAVFGGFSAQALADRIDDADSDVVVTIDGYYRRGEFLDHKSKADEAIELAETDVETVLLFTREDDLHEDVEITSGDPYVLVDEVREIGRAHV
mgnify:FL=1